VNIEKNRSSRLATQSLGDYSVRSVNSGSPRRVRSDPIASPKASQWFSDEHYMWKRWQLRNSKGAEMNSSRPFSNLNFSVNRRPISSRLIAVGVAFVAFTLIWLVVPDGGLYWLLLPVILGLAWAASYGWRLALASLIQFLRFLLER
jgi:hypothetical protein